MSSVRPVRRLGLVAATLSSVLLAAACGGGSSSNPSATSSSAAAGGEFSQKGPITYARAKDNSGYAPKEVAVWNSQHPDEKVTLRTLPDSADQQRQQLIQNAQLKADNITVMTTDVVLK